MMQRAHSGLGASSMSRWMNCPGSYQLARRVTPPRPTIYAATGTVAHDLIEASLERPDHGDFASAVLGTARDADGHTVVIDEKLLHGVAVMDAYVRQAAHDYERVWVERRVSLDDYFPKRFPPPEPMYGWLDVGLLSIDRHFLEVVDYKNGGGVYVDAADNPQLLYYAAAALRELSPEARAEITTVRLTIVQPNADKEYPVRSWDTSAFDVEMWVDEVLIPAVRALQAANAPFVPGDWCRFCPAARACPKLQEAALLAAQKSFEPVDISGKQLAGDLEIAERAEIWIDAIRTRAEEELHAGHPVPGWALVDKRARRVWTDPDQVREVLGRLVNDLSQYEHRELFTPAHLQEVLRDRPDLWREVAHLAERLSSGKKLGRARIALTPTP